MDSGAGNLFFFDLVSETVLFYIAYVTWVRTKRKNPLLRLQLRIAQKRAALLTCIPALFFCAVLAVKGNSPAFALALAFLLIPYQAFGIFFVLLKWDCNPDKPATETKSFLLVLLGAFAGLLPFLFAFLLFIYLFATSGYMGIK